MTAHSKLPWRIEGNEIVDADDVRVATIDDTAPEERPNAELIVLAVNLLTGTAADQQLTAEPPK